jgi:hypothetical protein
MFQVAREVIESRGSECLLLALKRPSAAPPESQLIAAVATHDFLGVGTGVPAIFTFTAPRWVRLVK